MGTSRRGCQNPKPLATLTQRERERDTGNGVILPRSERISAHCRTQGDREGGGDVGRQGGAPVAQRGQASQGVRCWQARSGVVVVAQPGVSLGVDGGGIRRSIVEGCVVEAVRGCVAAGAAGHFRGRAAANGRQLTYLSPSLLLSLSHTHTHTPRARSRNRM